jgi:phosphoribosylaminoimidazolecarboxamide formyltransferase/IMP cyclohydrolase
MHKQRFALVSVYNKSNLEKICDLFKKNNIEIISTGLTAKHIIRIGYHCFEVSSFTKFKEILDGRVKTLHPLIHASLLFDRKNKNHLKLFKKLNFPEINFVVVNLYPFEKTLMSSSNKKKCIEMIDIGGTTLLRSAAKNFNSITAISNINDYDIFIKNMKKNHGKTSMSFRKKMAAKVFEHTSSYDNLVSNWINKDNNNLKIINHEKKILRYGENPHQKSFFYKKKFNKNLFNNLLQQDKKLSFNNIVDVDSAYECLREFNEPTCVIIKHNMPCGVASDSKIEKAFIKAYNTDSISAFGGILALNRKINENISHFLVSKFFEVIIAPSFSKEAIKILQTKKKLILIETRKLHEENKMEIKSVHGGYLVQEKNTVVFSKNKMECVSNKKATDKQIRDLIFAFKVSKYIKSNAIVLVQNKQTIGIGSGQTSRIHSTKIALSKISSKFKKIGFVAASDAFFPFTDSIKLLVKKNCKAIIQPKGSINDHKIINYANIKKISLYFSNYRFFRH